MSTKAYRPISFLVIVIILGLSLAACADNNNTAIPALNAATQAITTNKSTTTTPTLTATPSTIPVQDWQDRWLHGIPCHLPCWEGITPGVTTYDEAVKLISNNPLASNIHFATFPKQAYYPSHDELKVIFWDWAGKVKNHQFITYAQGDTTVRAISLPYLREFSLKEIIAAYGEPQYIAPYTQPDTIGQTYWLSLIFANKGLVISIWDAKPKILEEKLMFNQLYIYGPNLEDMKLALPLRDEWLQPWQGFKEYDYSCIKVAYLINGCGKMPVKLP